MFLLERADLDTFRSGIFPHLSVSFAGRLARNLGSCKKARTHFPGQDLAHSADRPPLTEDL